MIDFGELTGQFGFYLLRHGKSEGNAQKIAQGQVDLPLTDEGREQAARAARWFEDKKIGVVLSSPLQRAAETAEIIASHLGLDGIEMREELIEIDIGLFSGLRWQEVEEQYPREQRSFFRYWWDGVPGAETSDKLYDRGEAIWRLLFGYCHQGQRNILVVTHSGLLQWTVKATMDNRRWFPILPMGNCSVYKLAVDNRLVPPSPEVPETTPYQTWRWELMGHRVGDA